MESSKIGSFQKKDRGREENYVQGEKKNYE
jgi:hypothetical protein